MFSNYSVKKILPRLVIVAIAVNLSFYICAAMVDLSNILGVNLRDFARSPAGQFAPDVSGGLMNAIGVGTSIVTGVLATVGGIILVLCNLGTVLVGALLVFAVLALREVLVTVLIIISPIAFVLYLLPNTEKWFKKWLNEFARALFVYPVIAFVWGATELITFIVINNPSLGDITKIIMACLVQLVPVVTILPIMKMGGQALGQLQGLVKKGLDATPIKEAGNAVGHGVKSLGLTKASQGLRRFGGNAVSKKDLAEKMADGTNRFVKDEDGDYTDKKTGQFYYAREVEARKGRGAARRLGAGLGFLGGLGEGQLSEKAKTFGDYAKQGTDAVGSTEKLKVQLDAKLKGAEHMVVREAEIRSLKAKVEGPTESSYEFRVLTEQLRRAEELGDPEAIAAASKARDDFQGGISDAKKAALDNVARTAGVSLENLAMSLATGDGISRADLEKLNAANAGINLDGIMGDLTYENLAYATDGTTRDLFTKLMGDALRTMPATEGASEANINTVMERVDHLRRAGVAPTTSQAVYAAAVDKHATIEEAKALRGSRSGTGSTGS